MNPQTVSTNTTLTTPIAHRVSLVLLFTRISIFITMIVWVLDKFVKPEHTAKVFESFYGIGGISAPISYVLGAIQLVIVLAFLVGFQKKISYGLVFLMHAASTLISFPRYLAPFDNLLFYSAWPMLAACFAMYWLRDLDVRGTIGQDS